MEKRYPTRPGYPEEKYVDYDDDTACWGVFGLVSGFCYSMWATEAQAESKLKES